MKSILFGIILLVSSALAQQCTNLQVSDVSTFSTTNTKLNTETVYVVQFRVKCSGNAKHVPLFAEVNGKLLTSSSDETGERQEFSWTESNEKARSGQVSLKVYDEEGFAALKKAQRTNGDLSKVKELQTLSLYHQGTYRGPSIQSEFFVTLLFAGVFYWAQSTRTKIQA